MSESIVGLIGPERVRKRVRIIFGSDGIAGVHHGLAQLVDMFSAEAMAGYGNKIIMTLFRDASVGIQDFGRGIYVGSAADPDGVEWKTRFSELLAGSKFHPESDTMPALFESAEVGFMGPGGHDTLNLCANQYVCEYMNVRINRDGYAKHLCFEKGTAVGALAEMPDDSPTGTYLHFRYDSEVFREIVPDADCVRKLLSKSATENKGIKYVLQIEGKDGFSEELFLCEKQE